MKLCLALLPLVLLPLAAFAQQDTSAMEQELIRLVNQERAKAGVPALRVDDQLTAAARAHSERMAQHKTLAHTVDGEPELSQRITATGLRFNAVAENVSLVEPSDATPPAAEAHAGLMSSPPHRANILNPDYNSVGIGVVRQGNTYYTTEDFAKAYAAMTPADAERTIAGQVNDLRRRRSMLPLRVVPLDRLNSLACGDNTSVQSLLQHFTSARSAAVFTTWTPGELPRQMAEYAGEQGLEAISLHACTLPPARGGSGGFKIAAVFF